MLITRTYCEQSFCAQILFYCAESVHKIASSVMCRQRLHLHQWSAAWWLFSCCDTTSLSMPCLLEVVVSQQLMSCHVVDRCFTWTSQTATH